MAHVAANAPVRQTHTYMYPQRRVWPCVGADQELPRSRRPHACRNLLTLAAMKHSAIHLLRDISPYPPPSSLLVRTAKDEEKGWG